MEKDASPQRTLLLLGSARKESTTRGFAQQLLGPVPHTTVDLLDYVVGPYDYRQEYPATDDFLVLVGQMQRHDTILFATPVYWYAMSGRLKTFFDRITDLTTTHKELGRRLAGKAVYVLATGTDPELPPGFAVPFEKTSAYLHMRFGRTLYYSTQHTSTAELAALATAFRQALAQAAHQNNS